jgi:hypothetical protein
MIGINIMIRIGIRIVIEIGIAINWGRDSYCDCN